MAVQYYKGWFRAKRRPSHPIDEATARELHEKCQLYVAVLVDGERLKCFIEINDDYFGVGFLDELCREYLVYGFTEKHPGRLFLSQSVYRVFVADTDKLATACRASFDVNGTAKFENSDRVRGTRSTKVVQADLAGNWEDYPEFGDYDSITQLERTSTRIE